MSNFVVSARKYRPAKFSELVGQNHVATTLKNALESDKLAHAFLFCGPRGVGKTTSARILAKVINCENVQGGVDPCNECSSCVSFNDNASFNIIELDAASNNSVEHIRTLTEQVRFQPQQGKYKVFIIDEVHMLSSQAFNAFLKTLEEPPPYAIFILATTEKHKIIPTILSRCQIFDFKRIQVQDIVHQLNLINEKEGRTGDPEAMHMIGQKADGAMRDALSIYDKISSATEEHITYQDVIENLNILDYDYYFKLTDSLVNQDLPGAMLLLEDIISRGFEPALLLQGLTEHIRNILVAKDPRTHNLIEGGEALVNRYKSQALVCGKSFCMTAMHLLNQCDISLPRAQNKRLYLEIALSKIVFMGAFEDEEVVKKKLKRRGVATTSKKQEKKEEAIPESDHQSQPTEEGQEVSDADGNMADHPENEIIPDNLLSDTETEENLSVAEPVATESSDRPIEEKDIAENAEDKIVNTPSFSSIDKLMMDIKTKEKEKEEARKSLSLDGINEIWKDYSDHNSSKSLRSALNLVIKKLEGENLIVTVPNGLTRDMVLEETALLDRIRDEMGVDKLTLQMVVDYEQFPGFDEVETKKVLTSKEKYEMLVESNPLVAELRKRFDLKVDNGKS